MNIEKKKITETELREIVWEVKEYANNDKIVISNIVYNIIGASASIFIFGFNPIALALSYIVFDALCMPIDKYTLKRAVRSSIKNIEDSKDFKKIMNKYRQTWDCENEHDGLAYWWYKELENCLEQLSNKEQKQNEEELLKENVIKQNNKDLVNIEKSIENFVSLYEKMENEDDKKIFKPCYDSCNYITNKMKEGFRFYGSYDKQYIVYLQEFIKNLQMWNGFTSSQKDTHKEDMEKAANSFEIWTKKTILSIEKEVASDLRVSIKTLANMLEEDIENTQKLLDAKKEKTNEN